MVVKITEDRVRKNDKSHKNAERKNLLIDEYVYPFAIL